MADSEDTELCFPKLLNSSCRRTMRPPSVSLLIYMALSSFSVLTFTLNLLVIISISHFKKLHTPTNILLLSLAVSDFFVGFFFLLQILIINGCWYLGDLACSLYFLLDYIITSSSVGTVVLISIDRYVAICDPMHYPTKVTKGRAKVLGLMCWVGSAFCHSLMLKDNVRNPGKFNSCVGECAVVIDFVAGLSNFFLTFIGPAIIILVLYVRVFAVAASQARTLRRSHITAVTPHSSVKAGANKSEMKAARTLGVVVIMFLLCLCPYYYVTISADDAVVSASSAAFVICLYYLNSCINPLIYAFFYPWFRRCIKMIVTLQILKPGSCEANVL